MSDFCLIASLSHGTSITSVIVAFGFAPIDRPGRTTVPAHSYVNVIGSNALTLHSVVTSMSYKWAPSWEDIMSGDWQVWQARPFVDMSKVIEPLTFMTYPGAICVTEPGRMHAPLCAAAGDVSPGYDSARDAAIARLPSSAHLPAEAVLLSLYFFKDELVCQPCDDCDDHC
jgi:hypothetical protein